MSKNIHQKRYELSLKFIERHFNKNDKILELGTSNKLTEILKTKGYNIINTQGEDLDINYFIVKDYDNILALEIFEHMLCPMNLLKKAKGHLITSIPIKLWFKHIYWNEKDDWDCHYHEFEKKQFDMLLKRTGWRIIDSELWKIYDLKPGIRNILRMIYPRYYMIYAIKD